MPWFENLLACFTHEQIPSAPAPTPARELYKAAGCFFTDGRYFLAGYQPHKNRPRISGIGGGRKPSEIVIYTALRETIEELFHIKYVSRSMIVEITKVISIGRLVENGPYSNLVLTFDDLALIMQTLARLQAVSPLFDTFPTTITELLFNRTVSADAEISHLALLPCVKGIVICHSLLRDIEMVVASSQ